MRLIVQPRKFIVRGEKQKTGNKPQTMSNKRKTGTVLSKWIQPQWWHDTARNKDLHTYSSGNNGRTLFCPGGTVVKQLGRPYRPRTNLYTCEKTICYTKRVCRVETRWQRAPKTRANTLSTDTEEYYILYAEMEEGFTRVVQPAKLSHAENSSVNNLES